ncbi:hypothetical protein PR048_027901 [Dryococelus australis]|uniref:DDE Tnp4 domain-containing protein n=1 Tax=Dryococelus australis TaxID=614101 RepID=A0ABQ9GHR0_9NEOP|nr:hypothetical protein PR048_027901 [Dryococelus australis]
MAIVDHNYCFLCIDVGGYGENSDGGVFDASAMGQKLLNGTLNTPRDRPLPGQNEPTPCVPIGDEAFPLRPNLMRPFPSRQSRHDKNKHVYNKRLCRARRVVENTFDILAQKWRVFYRPIEVKVETVISLVKATFVLHNYLRSKKGDLNLQQLLEAPEPMLGAFQNLPIDGRRATNESFYNTR